VTDGFMGPPWQMDWRIDALAVREALPEHARGMVDAARAELVTAKDPYFRGIDTDAGLPEGMRVMPDSPLFRRAATSSSLTTEMAG
jgi:hypothetical protein